MEKKSVGLVFKIFMVFAWLILLGGIAGLVYAVAVNHFI